MSAARKRKKTPAKKQSAPKASANKKPQRRKSPARKKASRKKNARSWKSLVLYFSIVMLAITGAYIAYLDHRVTEKFAGKIWSLPSYVYARPLELYVGRSISVPQLLQELKLANYKKLDQAPGLPGQYRQLDYHHFQLISREFAFADGMEPSRFVDIQIRQSRIVALQDGGSGQPLDLLRLDPARIAGIYPTQARDRQLVRLADVPDALVLALVSVEDRRFYQHWGVDPISIGRALLANITAGETVQGGSTLTQQLVKNLFLSSERSLWRKINEAIMALMLELHYDKSLILETYINEVYLGQNGASAIHGFALASQFYFAKPLNRLSVDQLALLVGLVKGASWYDPRRHPERALQRRNQVLKHMLREQVIGDEQYAELLRQPLKVVDKAATYSNRFPAFIDLVMRQLKQDYAPEDLQSAGLRIFTSLDPMAQLAAEKSASRIIPALEKSRQQVAQLQTAVLIASPNNGEIQALLGDRNGLASGFNRALDIQRQIGSLIKPAIYLAALQQGKYTPASLLDDSPLRMQGRDGSIWNPQNYDKQYLGKIPLARALVESRNVPTVRLGLDVGLKDIVATLKNLGLNKKIPPYPSIMLGALDLSPMEVASIYQTLAARGFHIPLRAIRDVVNSQGEVLKRYPIDIAQTLDERAVFQINQLLHLVTTRGTARYLKNRLDVDVAGKTGTTDDLRDSWFAGFSEDRLAVVWLGRDDNQGTGLTGSAGALRLWADIMQQIPLQSLQLSLPETLEMHWIDWQSGGLSEQGCKAGVELAFLPHSQPSQRATCSTPSIFERLKSLFK